MSSLNIGDKVGCPYYLLDNSGNYEWVDSWEEGLQKLQQYEEQFPDAEWELFDANDDTDWDGYHKF